MFRKGEDMTQTQTKEKKELIIDAAIQVFSDKGVIEAKVSDIVKVAGLAQGTFYLYFSSKFSLVPALAERLLYHTFTSVKEHTEFEKPIGEQLEQMIDIIFAVTAKYKDILAICYSGMVLSGDMHKWEKIYEPFYAWMTDWLKAAQAKKQIRADLNPRITAKMVIGLIEETAEQIFLFGSNNGQQEEHQRELIGFLHYALGIN